MFSNKKNNLPPRPHIPDAEHILEDLNNAAVDDITFKIINKGFNTFYVIIRCIKTCIKIIIITL